MKSTAVSLALASSGASPTVIAAALVLTGLAVNMLWPKLRMRLITA